MATLAGCASPDPSASTDGNDASSSAHRSDAADGAVGPSDLLLSLLTPVSGDDMRAVNDLERADHRLFAEAMQQCMAEQGFELNYHSNQPADRTPHFFDFPDLASIDEYGFTANSQDYQSEADRIKDAITNAGGGAEDGSGDLAAETLPEGMSAGEARALLDADRTCAVEFEDESPLTGFRQRHTALHSAWMEELTNLEKSGDLDDAEQTWADCMAGHGWAASSQDEFFAQVDGLIQNADGPDDAQAVQQDAASHYVDCTAKLEQVRQPLRQQLRERFVDANYAALVEAEQDLRDVVEELNG